jgi:hypothetical protein
MQTISSDLSMTSTLSRVPFTVPISGMTFEEYLEHQSWRIEIQVLAMLLADKSTPKSKIIDQLVAINRRASRFLEQPLPEDIPTTISELTIADVRPGTLSIPLIIQNLTQTFS